MNSGVYQIRNLVTDGIYIGSTTNFVKRITKHTYMLKNNEHHCVHLQRSFNKYGEKNFIVDILAVCPVEYLQKLEQWFLDNRKEKRYNILANAYHSTGFKHSDKFKEWLSNRQLNMSQETKDKIRNSLIGFKHSQKSKDKISEGHKGKIISEESRAKISEGNRTFTDETIIEVFRLYNLGDKPRNISIRLGMKINKVNKLLGDGYYVLIKERLGLERKTIQKLNWNNGRKNRLL